MKKTPTTTHNSQVEQQNQISPTSPGDFENRIGVAIYGPKIRQINPDNDEPIKQVLRYVFALIGLKPETIQSIDDAQKSVLIGFIRNDLANFGLDEIRIAFHLAVNRKLDVDVEHFQSFSPLYLGKIMDAYSRYRSTIVAKNKFLFTSTTKPEPTDQEKKEIFHEFIRNTMILAWKKFLQHGRITFGITPWSIVYKTLTEDMELLDLNIEEKKNIHKRAKEAIRIQIERPSGNIDEQRKKRHTMDLIGEIGFDKAMKDQIVEKCHEISIEDFFNQAKNDGVDLQFEFEEFIKKNQLS